MPKLFKTAPNRHRKLWIILAVFVLLAGAGVGGYYYWQSTQQTTSDSSGDELQKLDDDALVLQVNKLVSAKEYDKALALIKFQDGGITDPTNARIYAGVLQDKGEPEEALKVLSAARGQDKTQAYLLKGQEARALANAGRIEEAIARYEEGIKLAEEAEAELTDENAAFEAGAKTADYQWEIDQLRSAQ